MNANILDYTISGLYVISQHKQKKTHRLRRLMKILVRPYNSKVATYFYHEDVDGYKYDCRMDSDEDNIILLKNLPTPFGIFNVYQCMIKVPKDETLRHISDILFWSHFADFLAYRHIVETFSEYETFAKRQCEHFFAASYHLLGITNDSVFIEEAIDFIIEHRLSKHLLGKLPCKYCGRITSKRCRRCKVVHYCNKNCLARDRAKHKSRCISFSNIPRLKSSKKNMSIREIFVKDMVNSLQMDKYSPICRICAASSYLRRKNGSVYCVECSRAV